MYKTASEIADDVLKKVAAPRALKALVQQAEKYLPGITKKVKQEARISPSVGDDAATMEAIYRTLDRRTPQALISNDPRLTEKAQKALTPYIDALSLRIRGKTYPATRPQELGDLRRARMLNEGVKPEDIRRMTTGRHAPRSGEFVIPSGGPSGEITANLTPARTSYLYRGNPWQKGEAVVSSAHPDVASAYALGHATQSKGIPTRDLYVLRKRGLRSMETYGDYYRPTPRSHVRWTSKEPFSGLHGGGRYEDVFRRPEGFKRHIEAMGKTHHTRMSQTNPTYETVISPETPPRIAARYRVRDVRLPGGDPGYGLTRMWGTSPSRTMGAFEVA